MDNELKDFTLHFDEIAGIKELTFICGLNFPESATEFQKAVLTLAHLTAMCRENVLHGVEVPHKIIIVIGALSDIISSQRYTQK